MSVVIPARFAGVFAPGFSPANTDLVLRDLSRETGERIIAVWDRSDAGQPGGRCVLHVAGENGMLPIGPGVLDFLANCRASDGSLHLRWLFDTATAKFEQMDGLTAWGSNSLVRRAG
jgi:hypothetical protein